MPRDSFQDTLPFVIDNEENETISLQSTSHKPRYLPEEENEPSNNGDLAPLLSSSSRDSILPDSNNELVSDSDTLELPKDGGSLFESFLNMANSIIGAGIIGLPYAFLESGIFSGVILLIGLTILVDWTIRLLIYNAKLSGRNSYQEIMQFCFGKSGLVIISGFQLIFAFGGMCAFCVIIGDTIPHVIMSLFSSINNPVLEFFTNRNYVIMFCTIFISYPLSLYRDISKLSKASGLALISMTIIITAVIIEAPQVDQELRGGNKDTWDFIPRKRIFQSISIISFAFVCHHNSLLIFGSLHKPTLNRFAAVTHLSTGISMLACLMVALTGYITFTDRTEGNILNNFPKDNVIINIARFCFGFNMFTTLPLEAFVCRESIEIYYFSNAPFSIRRHVILTTALVMGAMIVSLSTKDLGIVLELTGGCSATALAYILPPACFLKLSSGKWWNRKKLPAVLCIGFGIAVMILSTILSIIHNTINK